MSNKNEQKPEAKTETLTDDIEKLENELLECQETIEDYKKQIDSLNEIKAKLEVENKELVSKLEAEQKKVEVSATNSVIMDKKKLDPKKKYTTGPSGMGYVEVK